MAASHRLAVVERCADTLGSPPLLCKLLERLVYGLWIVSRQCQSMWEMSASHRCGIAEVGQRHTQSRLGELTGLGR